MATAGGVDVGINVAAGAPAKIGWPGGGGGGIPGAIGTAIMYGGGTIMGTNPGY